MHGGAADRSGLIHVGDEVIEVNGINVEGKTPNDVLEILVKFRKFKKIPFLKLLDSHSKTLRVRLISSCYRPIQSRVNAKVRFGFVLILTITRTPIRIFRAKKPDCNLIAVKFCTLFRRFVKRKPHKCFFFNKILFLGRRILVASTPWKWANRSGRINS